MVSWLEKGKETMLMVCLLWQQTKLILDVLGNIQFLFRCLQEPVDVDVDIDEVIDFDWKRVLQDAILFEYFARSSMMIKSKEEEKH